MSDHSNSLGVQVLILFNVIHRAAQSPRPRAQRVPFVRVGRGLPTAVKMRDDRILQAVFVVGEQVTAVNRRHRVSTFDDHLHRPAGTFSSARLFRCMVVHCAGLFAIAQPRGRQRNARIIADGLIAVEIQTDENRRGLLQRRCERGGTGVCSHAALASRTRETARYRCCESAIIGWNRRCGRRRLCGALSC